MELPKVIAGRGPSRRSSQPWLWRFGSGSMFGLTVLPLQVSYLELLGGHCADTQIPGVQACWGFKGLLATQLALVAVAGGAG